MQLTALLFATVLATGQDFGVSSTVAVIKNCGVSLPLVAEVHVAAQEPGQLLDVAVKRGDEVTKDKLLAQIDASKPQAELRAASAKLAAASLKANDTINERYAHIAAQVSNATLNIHESANKKVGGSVPHAQILELQLKSQETQLATEKAKLDRNVAACEAEQAAGEKGVAEQAIMHRQVTAPLDGIVVDLKKRRGEWVQPGDEILHIVNMQTLEVWGYVSAKELNRSELVDRPVTVEFDLARGQKETLTGKVVFCDPISRPDKTYIVRADVTNRKLATGAWSLNPGDQATMTIRLR